jgi:Zinc carboxypeptidase
MIRSKDREQPAAGDLADIMAMLERVPDRLVFPTVDEMVATLERLHAEHPDVTQMRRVGSSRLGEPIVCLTVGGGRRQALVFAMPHPNEPIGGVTTGELARQLCEDAATRASFDFTWHIVPCIDPDGTRLNEGWFNGPFDSRHYGRNFYRPAFTDQPDWTFPFSHKQAYFDQVLPETVALMRLIDEVKPDLMCSLHNGESGGVFYYVSRPTPGLYAALQEIPGRFGLPLDHGEPEAPYTPLLAPGVFLYPRRADEYDFIEQSGGDPLAHTHGESSAHYASRHGTLSVVSELPYWTREDADDQSPSETRYADALRRTADDFRTLAEALRGTFAQAGEGLTLDTPFLRASRSFVATVEEIGREAAWRAGEEENQRLATVAELTSAQGGVHTFRIRVGGMLLRALEAQIDAGLAAPAVRDAHRRFAAQFERWCDEADRQTPRSLLPIAKLVGTQLGTIVAAARYIESGADRDV